MPKARSTRALGVAVRNAVELLASSEPLVIAVDDVEWLDPSSAAVLAFAFRRLRAPVRLLLARRMVEGSEASDLEHSLAHVPVERIGVGPLTVGALQLLLRDHFGRTFSRPVLVRIHEASGGNPFYALELARALGRDADPARPLRVPETLDGLVSARLTGLPETTREVLALVAAHGVASTALIRDAGFSEADLEPALAAHVVDNEDGRVRFAHPLLASALYQGLADSERRNAHRLLARVVDDPIGRARHLALASDGPDAEIAASLEDAAAGARAQGAPAIAVELGELAHRLTPPGADEDRRRRAILVASAHLRAGDVHRARVLAEDLVAEAPDGRARAEALVLMSGVESRIENPGRAVELRREALLEADGHPALQAAVHQWLGANVPYREGVRVRESHARRSLELAEQLGDDGLRAGALAILAWSRFDAGEPDALALAEEAHALATKLQDSQSEVPASIERAHLLAWLYDRLDLVASFVLADILTTTGRFDRARRVLDGVHREVAQRDELLEGKVLWVLSMLELEAGHWALAADHIARDREILDQYGLEAEPGVLLVGAELALNGGDLPRARELVALGREQAEDGILAPLEAILGLVDRSSGDPEAAIERFAAAETIAGRAGWGEPSMLWWRADHAEALVELGRLSEAVELVDRWEADAMRLGRARVLAHATRCRGVFAAARGDVALAVRTLEEAARQYEAVEDPFGRARALLALGATRRRARQKRAARETIEAALAAFEELGAVGWAEKARAELGTIGGRTREEGLTPAERRVAALVAEGRTNREVAAALVLGERTVESHLTHIYAKLGVRSRTELARVYDHAT